MRKSVLREIIEENEERNRLEKIVRRMKERIDKRGFAFYEDSQILSPSVSGPRRRWVLEIDDLVLAEKKRSNGFYHWLLQQLYKSGRSHTGNGWKPRVVKIKKTLYMTHEFLLEEMIPTQEAIDTLEKYTKSIRESDDQPR